MDPENSSVLVLLVATNGEPWLREVIVGIRNQTHDDLTVVAVDNASTDGSRKLLEKAFGRDHVIRLDRRVGYGRALSAGLKLVAERAIPTDAFLLLHDDAVMDAGAVEAMLEALSRERVGVVGAKLVEFDAPETLQEVGLTTDRFGRLYNPLEPGELDNRARKAGSSPSSPNHSTSASWSHCSGTPVPPHIGKASQQPTQRASLLSDRNDQAVRISERMRAVIASCASSSVAPAASIRRPSGVSAVAIQTPPGADSYVTGIGPCGVSTRRCGMGGRLQAACRT